MNNVPFIIAGLVFIFLGGVEKKNTQKTATALKYESVAASMRVTDPCESARAGVTKATRLANHKVFIAALQEIKAAFAKDSMEHSVSFATSANGEISSSPMSKGNAMNSSVPALPGAIADLHNHPGNFPPASGDLYGLIDLNTNYNSYDTRFAVTQNGTIYALIITDAQAATVFNHNFPRVAPAYKGSSPTFPESLVDEFRELKYLYNCNDEMALAYILEKYNTGISLLKQTGKGSFKKLRTVAQFKGEQLLFTAADCEL
ncbi:MAG TPA: hypothetical protein VLR49_00730 [Ferruginibacter sp.]|nr:hypothetical protein [Ferruginibacter sp.]